MVVVVVVVVVEDDEDEDEDEEQLLWRGSRQGWTRGAAEDAETQARA